MNQRPPGYEPGELPLLYPALRLCQAHPAQHSLLYGIFSEMQICFIEKIKENDLKFQLFIKI